MEKQVINRGYLTYSLTDGEHYIYGLYNCLRYEWEAQGDVYWSDVFVDGDAFAVVRRGEKVTGKTKEELDTMVRQSIINLDWQKELCKDILKTR